MFILLFIALLLGRNHDVTAIIRLTTTDIQTLIIIIFFLRESHDSCGIVLAQQILVLFASVQSIFRQECLHVIDKQIRTGNLLLLLSLLFITLLQLLHFRIIISVDFKIVKEFTKRNNKVLSHLEPIMIHILRDY